MLCEHDKRLSDLRESIDQPTLQRLLQWSTTGVASLKGLCKVSIRVGFPAWQRANIKSHPQLKCLSNGLSIMILFGVKVGINDPRLGSANGFGKFAFGKAFDILY